jgi:glycosyltransferase involved in cell wall biosynthesis
MPCHFRGSDAFIFTSVRDASGGVNLEAMSHGLPIICIAHQGVGDITDGTCAIGIPPGPIPETIDKLAAAMQQMADDPALRGRMAENARHRAKMCFSWEDKFKGMMGIYESVARHPPRLD